MTFSCPKQLNDRQSPNRPNQTGYALSSQHPMASPDSGLGVSCAMIPSEALTEVLLMTGMGPHDHRSSELKRLRSEIRKTGADERPWFERSAMGLPGSFNE